MSCCNLISRCFSFKPEQSPWCLKTTSNWAVPLISHRHRDFDKSKVTCYAHFHQNPDCSRSSSLNHTKHLSSFQTHRTTSPLFSNFLLKKKKKKKIYFAKPFACLWSKKTINRTTRWTFLIPVNVTGTFHPICQPFFAIYRIMGLTSTFKEEQKEPKSRVKGLCLNSTECKNGAKCSIPRPPQNTRWRCVLFHS